MRSAMLTYYIFAYLMLTDKRKSKKHQKKHHRNTQMYTSKFNSCEHEAGVAEIAGNRARQLAVDRKRA